MNNGQEIVLKIGKHQSITASEVNDFLGFSDSNSEGSDWEELKETTADDFLLEKKENKPVKRKFDIKIPITKQPSKRVMPGDVVPESNTLVSKKKLPINNHSKYFIAVPTKIRVLNPQITNENWNDRTSSRQVFTPSKLCRDKMSDSLIDADWILVGVVVQVMSKKDKTDKNFCIWYLNDLQCLDKIVKVMLFRDVYDKFWKEDVGTVVAILQPKCLPSNENFKSKAYTVDSGLQILVLGRSPDYGICQGKTKNGDKCTNIVNKTDCPMCSYHIQSGYINAISRPGFANLGFEKLNDRKRQAPTMPWIKDKKPKLDGIYVNNRINSQLSLEKLQQSGITARATGWGLLDKSSVPEVMPAPVKLTTKDISMIKLLRNPSAGSMNLVKHIVNKSINPDDEGNNIVKQNRASDKNKSNNSQTSVVKSVTFDSFKKKCLENKSKSDASSQSIDLGYKPIKLDQVNAEVYRAELNKLRLAAKAKEMGGYAALKESNKREFMKNISVTIERRSSLSEKSKKPILNGELLKLLNQGSSNKKLVEIENISDFDKKLDKMEIVEKFETKLTSQHEEECFLFICVECQTKTGRNPKTCVTEGHTVKSVKGFRKFYQCIKCKTRTITYNKYPDGSCLKCGACVYEKTGKIKAREVECEKLLVHGNEKRFINN